jgi:hypothetical protein
VTEFCAKPFAVTTSVAVSLNAVPMLLGLAFGVRALGETDCAQLGAWLLLQAVLSGGHVAMCLYCFRLMQKPYDLSEPNDRNFNARIQHLVMQHVH